MKIHTKTLDYFGFTSFESENTAFTLKDLASLTKTTGFRQSKTVYRIPSSLLEAEEIDIEILGEGEVKFNGKTYHPSFTR